MSTPWHYQLPTTLEVGETKYRIRSDYRVALDICAALSDAELNHAEKMQICLTILYEDYEDIPVQFYQEALEQCFWFLNGGADDFPKTSAKLVDWEQDFPLIVAPINRVVGQDVRGVSYLHWWSFLSAYYEIGDCTFAQVVNIRNKIQRGKKLEKTEKEWYRQNRHLVDFKHTLTNSENKMLEDLGLKKPTP